LREARNRVPGSWLLCVEHALATPSAPFVARSDDPVFFLWRKRLLLRDGRIAKPWAEESAWRRHVEP
jgi:hypothetical protein